MKVLAYKTSKGKFLKITAKGRVILTDHESNAMKWTMDMRPKLEEALERMSNQDDVEIVEIDV